MFKNKKVLIAVIAIVAVLFLACLVSSVLAFVYIRSKTKTEETNNISETTESTSQHSSSTTSTSTITSTTLNNNNGNNSGTDIIFVRRGDLDYNDDDELWIADWDGSNAHSLGITGVYEAYNGPNDEWIYYKKYMQQNKIYLYNLLTDEEREIIENDTAYGSATISEGNTISISPDGEKIVYNVEYFQTVCQEFCDWVDPYPESKQGFYSYDTVTESKTYLGKFLLVANWDSDSEYVYTISGEDYHTWLLGDGSYKINVSTGIATKMDDTASFGDAFYYLEDQNISIKATGETDTGAEINIEKAGTTTLIDEGEWAYIQPAIWPNPVNTLALYEKRTSLADVNAPFEKVLIDLDSLTTSEILIPEVSEEFGHKIQWVNDSMFVIQSTVGDFVDGEKDLILVDTETGDRTQITDFGDVDFK